MISTLCITLMKRDLILPDLEENMLWEDTLLERKDALPANFVKMLALPMLLQLKVNLDQMDQEEQPSMTSIWLNAFIVDFARKLALLMLLLRSGFENKFLGTKLWVFGMGSWRFTIRQEKVAREWRQMGTTISKKYRISYGRFRILIEFLEMKDKLKTLKFS